MLARNLYFDGHFKRDAAKIMPGEYYVTERDMVLVTVLGSCVSVCLRDKSTGIGGMNHFMLPDSKSEREGPASASARYGAYAMELLVNDLVKLGAQRTNFEAKVFGGGSVLPGMSLMNIGERNAQFALHYLGMERITVAASDLIDIYPRKVYYFPRTGRVLVKKLRNLHYNTIFEREMDYRSRLAGEVQGEVELFG